MMWFPLRDAQQDPPVTHCNVCGSEIYLYDNCELDGSLIYCETCADERASNHEYRVSMTGKQLQDYLKSIYGGG